MAILIIWLPSVSLPYKMSRLKSSVPGIIDAFWICFVALSTRKSSGPAMR
jgi:hypothetical protein